MKKIKDFLFKYQFTITLGLIYLIFFLLSFKNPYSERSLVPNLEPYPDTLYYATPAWNFVHGKGFNMSFEDHEVKSIMPPLYSIYLIPFFAVFSDVRSFYFANIALAFGSITLYLLILKKIFGNDFTGIFITFLLGFLYITNFYIYTFPSLLMAENITIFFVMLALYLLVSDIEEKELIFAAVLGLLLWLIKFSNLPLGLVFYFLYILKLLKSNLPKSKKKIYFILLTLSLLLFGLYIIQSRILADHKNLVPGTSFSAEYFYKNFIFYIKTLVAGESHSLWFRQKLITPAAAILIILGLIISLASSKFRLSALTLFFFTTSLIIFMSFYYTVDARFIMAIFPAILIFAGIPIFYIKKKLGRKGIIFFILIFLIFYLFLPNQGYIKSEPLIITLKKQIGLNFRHQETPWDYLAIKDFNKFFERSEFKNSYLGTVLPPFFITFYTNGHYKYLPITKNQDFFSEKGGLWEMMNIGKIDRHYSKLLEQGKRIFVSNYYLNNLSIWREDFEKLVGEFDMTLKNEGCLGSCNIYELTLKVR